MMREVLTELIPRWERGETAALATAVRTCRPARRPPGAARLRLADDSVLGWVSGGCVEGDRYERGGQVLETGGPMVQRYGISDDDAFAVGLTCGGVIDVFVEPVSKETFADLDALAADIAAERPVAVATVIAHHDPDWEI